jgi:ABC-type transporter MlaC component
VARSFIDNLVQLSKLSKVSRSVASTESTDLLTKLSSEVDYKTVARASLGRHYKSAKASERADFEKTLRDLIEAVAYPKAGHIEAATQALVYKNIGPTKIQVQGVIAREKNGERIVNELSLVLYFDSATHKIVDAEIEGERITVNLARQIDKALQKKKLTELIAQMRKRVDNSRSRS